MRIRRCTLHSISLPLREPMRTSYGIHRDKHAIVVVLETECGHTGVAECVAMMHPTYTEESVETAWHVSKDYLVPSLNGREFQSPTDIFDWFADMRNIRGHRMAKAGVEMALWDALAAETQTPLHELLGGQIRDVPVGISIGMADDAIALVNRARAACGEGYQRIKLKIAPNADFSPLNVVREAIGDVPLMADANSSYTLEDIAALKALDGLSLTMIEQPLAYDDIVDHAELQRRVQTPICLDESIRSVDDARRALTIGAAKVINLKPGRVGGFSESIRIHDTARSLGADLWCGGMYETGIGRLHNLALLSLPSFTLPTDNGPSHRYFVHDIVNPSIEFDKPGWLRVEPLCGVASRVNWVSLRECTNRTMMTQLHR